MQAGSLPSLQASQAAQLCRQTPSRVHARHCSVVQPTRPQLLHQRPSTCRPHSSSLKPARAFKQWICRAQAEEQEEENEDDIDPEDIAGVEGLDEDVEDIPEDSIDDGRMLTSKSNYENEGRRGRGRDSEYEERVIEVSRVTKVVKGGKQLGFRCVLAMGDEKGTVGVGCASAKEVQIAVQKAAVDAKKNLITIPLTKAFSFPHRQEAYFGAAKVMLRPASDGTGLIAGGSVRTVLELAGIQNGFGKQIGSPNPLNNARCTIECLSQMRSMQEIADTRGMSIKEMLTYQGERAVPSAQPV
ncbi:hypothetical protein WJX74_009733 [Apatococcus lobatus]|uniref:Small ribosomal subunit protein uS5c n=1 Tax=Apatococcus lobatus TaxID=904363 RepID=A0AAW1QIE4_9CHLO